MLKTIRPEIRQGTFDMIDCEDWKECSNLGPDEQVLIIYRMDDEKADNSFPGALMGRVRSARKDPEEDDCDPGIFNLVLSDLSKRMVNSAKAYSASVGSKAKTKVKWDLGKNVGYRLLNYHVVRLVDRGQNPITNVLKRMEDWDRAGNRGAGREKRSLLAGGRGRKRNNSPARQQGRAARASRRKQN